MRETFLAMTLLAWTGAALAGGLGDTAPLNGGTLDNRQTATGGAKQSGFKAQANSVPLPPPPKTGTSTMTTVTTSNGIIGVGQGQVCNQQIGGVTSGRAGGIAVDTTTVANAMLSCVR